MNTSDFKLRETAGTTSLLVPSNRVQLLINPFLIPLTTPGVMELIPDEVKVQILSYLSLSDLCQVSLVSRFWNFLALDHVNLFVCLFVCVSLFVYCLVCMFESFLFVKL